MVEEKPEYNWEKKIIKEKYIIFFYFCVQVDLYIETEVWTEIRGCHGRDHMVVGFTIRSYLCILLPTSMIIDFVLPTI
jgi:hypothetical protein